MAGVLTGLSSLGLEHLENKDIFAVEEDNNNDKQNVELIAKQAEEAVDEATYIYDKKMVCPVCEKVFVTKVMKSAKARLLSTDLDLRPVHEGIDANKYGVCQCTYCGYTALPNTFDKITESQKKIVKKQVCESVLLTPYIDTVYTYEDAIERYKLALACAVVKKTKSSEKAYICIRFAWLYRGYADYLEKNGKNGEAVEAKRAELSYLQNAYKGFVTARSTEDYPMCGMDSPTVDYLIAALAVRLKKYEIAEKLLSGLLTDTNTSKRIKDKARELKDLMKAEKAHDK